MTARQVTVKVFRAGKEIRQIERPLHLVGSLRAVVFKKRLWALQPGNQIVIDGPWLEEDSSAAASETAQQEENGGKTKPPAQSGQSPSVAAPAADKEAGQQTLEHAAKAIPDKWGKQQLAVIEAPADCRLLVDAGPGTGKTAVACRRVAWLIDQCGISPSNLWMVSFTRTAVREIRNRIRDYLQDPADAWSVKVATIDSQAWAIHSGFDAAADLSGGYEDNIARVTDLVRNHEGVFEYLETVEHLVVDEAQDIVGVRADLMLEMIRNLAPGCGVTVFADEAQAIYGFADEDGGSTAAEGHLPDRLRHEQRLSFQAAGLLQIYRTQRRHLVKLFTEVRSKVLAPVDGGGPERLARVTELIRGLADSNNVRTEILAGADPDALRRTFILYRRRVDALLAASFWGKAPHRLRMSGLPTIIDPWLAAMLWDRPQKKLANQEFERLWAERVQGRGLTSLEMQSAWELLVKSAGESKTLISLHALRSKLGRAAPPADFVRQDFGLGGPVFGTIHGCKGREADSVLLMLPASVRQDTDDDEEARVVFVGATRARVELRVGKGFKFLKSRKVDGSGRAYVLRTIEGKTCAQVEFGVTGDLSADGVAAKKLFSSSDDVLAAQKWLLDNAVNIVPAAGIPIAQLGWRYQIIPEASSPVAYLSEKVNAELFTIGKDIRKDLGCQPNLRPGQLPNHLKIFGASTMVIQPDDPHAALLHEPWATSGFVLAPVIQGMVMMNFKPY